MLRRVGVGILAGAIATVPMSAVVWGCKALGIYRAKPAPEAVTEGVMERLGNREAAHGASGQALKAVAHGGFGASAGAVYGLLTTVLRPTALTGALAGVAIWKSNYDTWIPAAGILPEPEGDEQGRTVTMVAAHVVYGATLGYIAGLLQSRA